MAESTNPNYLKLKDLVLNTTDKIYGRLKVLDNYVTEIVTNEVTHEYFEIPLYSGRFTELTRYIEQAEKKLGYEIPRNILLTDKPFVRLVTENALKIYSQAEYEGAGSGTGGGGIITPPDEPEQPSEEDLDFTQTKYIIGKDSKSPYNGVNNAIMAARKDGHDEFNPAYLLVKPGVYEERVDLYPGIHVKAQAPAGTTLMGYIVYHAPNDLKEKNIASWDGVNIYAGKESGIRWCDQTDYYRILEFSATCTSVSNDAGSVVIRYPDSEDDDDDEEANQPGTSDPTPTPQPTPDTDKDNEDEEPGTGGEDNEPEQPSEPEQPNDGDDEGDDEPTDGNDPEEPNEDEGSEDRGEENEPVEDENPSDDNEEESGEQGSDNGGTEGSDSDETEPPAEDEPEHSDDDEVVTEDDEEANEGETE